MIILPQTIKIKWHPNNKKYFELKGYKYTGINREFEVNIIDLPCNSSYKINCICDYCGKQYLARYISVNKCDKHPCRKCIFLKSKETLKSKYGTDSIWEIDEIKEKIKNTNLEKYGVEYAIGSKATRKKIKNTNLEKYGVENVFQSENIKEKIKQTLLEKYGVEYISQSSETKEKIKQTNLKRYGVEYATQNHQIQEKTKQTNLEKYGVEYGLKSEKVREKIKQTNLKRYGVDNPRKNKDIANKIKEKSNHTMYLNGNGPCSKPQQYLCNLFNIKPNYPIGRCGLDIAFSDEMIYIEYDGAGHDKAVKCGWLSKEEFNKYEIKRQYYLKSKGWKLIKIISNNDKLPDDIKILELVQECKDYLHSGHSWIYINIDESKIVCNQYIKYINLGILRNISDDNLNV